MAQDFAPLFRSIWSDPDWRSLSVDAQHLYELLMSHPDRNAAGVLPLLVRKWTRLASDLTIDRLETALTELEARNFVVVDDETDEVLVRSFVRRTKVYTHIRLLKNALREVSEIESPRVRSAACQELARLPRLALPDNPKMRVEAETAQAFLDELVASSPPPKGTGQRDAHPMTHGMAHPIAHPPVVVAGAVVGAGAVAPTSPKQPDESFKGVSHVSSGTGDETPLYPDRCHKHGNTYEPGNCGNCADVRKTNQRLASIGPHNPATKPHCGECDETRMLRTRFGAIPCPNCNPAAEAS